MIGKAMMNDFLKSYFPHARSDVLQGMYASFPVAFRKYHITENMLALALGQVFVESNGLATFDENLHYSASRITQIFGVGHNSAAVTPSEAQRLAGNPKALAERVYGTGPKAKSLGNLSPADGWIYRGGGPIQCTGRGMYAQISNETGIDFVGSPDKARNPLYFWDMIFGFFMVKNAMDYLDRPVNNPSITKITRITNGGTTALDERISATNRAVVEIRQHNALSFTKTNAPAPVLTLESVISETEEDGKDLEVEVKTESESVLDTPKEDNPIIVYTSPSDEILARYGDKDDEDVRELQQAFVTLNYWVGSVDGNFDVLTRDALFSFQANNGFPIESVLRVKHIQKLATAAPRVLPKARQNATPANTPALKAAFTIRVANWLKGIAVSALGLIGITASPTDTWNSIISAVFTNRSSVHDVLDPVANTFKKVVSIIGVDWLLRSLAIGAAIAIFLLAGALIKNRVEQYRDGANLHI